MISVKESTEAGTVTQRKTEKFQILNNLIYYVSYEEENSRLRLYVPKGLQVLLGTMSWKDGICGNWQDDQLKILIGPVCIEM